MKQIPIVMLFKNKNNERILYFKINKKEAHTLICDNSIDGNNRNAILVICDEHNETDTKCSEYSLVDKET